MSVTLESFWNRITRDVPTLHEINELQQDINRVIRDINQKVPGVLDTETPVLQVTDSETLTLTFAAAGKTINDDGLGDFTVDYGFEAGQKIWFRGTGAVNVTEMTIVSIGNDAATNDQIVVSEVITNDAAIEGILEGFTVLTDYSYDHVNKTLELKAAVKQLIDVIVDDVSMIRKEHDVVYDVDNESSGYYCMLGRSMIKLTSGIFGSEGGTIKVKILEEIAEITTATFATVIDIPQQYEIMLEQGVLYYLLSRPAHSGTGVTMELRDKNQRQYLQAIGALSVLETERIVDSENFELEYQYQRQTNAD